MLLFPHERKGKLHKYDSKGLAFRFVIQNKTLMKNKSSTLIPIIGAKLSTFTLIFIHILVLCTSICLYFE